MAISIRSWPLSAAFSQFQPLKLLISGGITSSASYPLLNNAKLLPLKQHRQITGRGLAAVTGKELLQVGFKSDGATNHLSFQFALSSKCSQAASGCGKRGGTRCMALVGSANEQALFCVLLCCAAAAQVMERKTKWGSYLSAPLLAMGGGMMFSHVGLIPNAAPTYDIVFSHIMPLAVALCLLETNVQEAFVKAGLTLKAFWLGAIATIIGTLVSFGIVGHLLGRDGWKIASCLCSSYIGGSINYAATAKALGLSSGSLLAAGMAADNLVMAIYFGVIMAIPAELNEEKPKVDSHHGSNCPDLDFVPTVETISISLFAATAACAIGNSVSAVLPSCFAGSSLALMALVASIISYVAARLFDGTSGANISVFAGSKTLGGSLMLIFFSVVGATSGIREAIFGGRYLLMFIVLLVGLHLMLILFFGRCCGVPMCMILIASNANIGGPATAAAMASARQWPGLVQPAILVGTLGYTIGTAVGCAVGSVFLKCMW